MSDLLSFSEFSAQFPTDESCLETIKQFRYPRGIYCQLCRKVTRHYRVSGRLAYACITCRHHVYPLAGTVMEKTATPLRLWFFTCFLMTQTRGQISKKQLQRELGVTYKTAWRMHTTLRKTMEGPGRNLLIEPQDTTNKVHKWVFFNKIQITVAEKQESLR